MRKNHILLGLAIIAICPASVSARPKNMIRIQSQIFRFTGNLGGKMSIDEQIWTTDEPPDELKDIVTVFSNANFRFGKDKLKFRDGRCLWNDKEFPISGSSDVKLPADRIKLYYSPEIITEEHGKGKWKIESNQPIQYFQKRPDGLFELKEMKLPTALVMKITEAIENERDGYIELTDILMTLRSVEKRQKIPGVNLSVGKPIIGKQQYKFYFQVRPGKDYGIIVRPQRGQGGLLIRLRASSTRSGTYNEKKKDD